MLRDEINGVGWSSYDDSFREDAHQLLAWGYGDSRPRITSALEETEITGFIVEAIEARLSAPDTDERFDRYCIKEDNPVQGEDRTGKRRRRIDIIVECTFRLRREPRRKYVFEAKRLHRSSHLISYYAGDEGVKRFVDGRYASESPEAAMVGYVQTDAADFWMAKLEERFDNDAAGELRVSQKLTRKIIVPLLTDEWVSGHERTTGTPITIYHILLNCLTLSSA